MNSKADITDKLCKRLGHLNTRVRELEEDIATHYERHGHTNTDWQKNLLEKVLAARQELLIVADIIGINIEKAR